MFCLFFFSLFIVCSLCSFVELLICSFKSNAQRNASISNFYEDFSPSHKMCYDEINEFGMDVLAVSTYFCFAFGRMDEVK